MHTKLFHRYDTKSKMANGVKKLHDAVVTTLGPSGGAVIIKHDNSIIPQVTKDGVTVANKIVLKDPQEDIGCQLVKQASIRTAINAGDGTTSTIVLSNALIQRLKDSNINGNVIKERLSSIQDLLLGKLYEDAIEVTSIDDIRNIATISANNDKFIGDLISSAYAKIGFDGHIDVIPSNTNDTVIEVHDGIKIDSGWSSHHWITDNTKLEYNCDDVAIVITDIKIDSGKKVLTHLLSNVAQISKNIVIIAENITGEALQTIVVNNSNNDINVCIINPPYYGHRRRLFLQDLCVLLNVKPLFTDNNDKIENFSADNVTVVPNVTVSQDNTIITVNPEFYNDEDSKSHLNSIKTRLAELIKTDPNSEETTFTKKRISNLTNGVATIKIGGNSDTEVYELKDRIDDALRAVESAIEDGIVKGGGFEYINLSRYLHDGEIDDIVSESLHEITRHILLNCGHGNDDITNIIDTIKSGQYDGYNAKTSSYSSNMIIDGIIDPTKVIKNCLINSLSIASMFAITANSVIDKN